MKRLTSNWVIAVSVLFVGCKADHSQCERQKYQIAAMFDSCSAGAWLVRERLDRLVDDSTRYVMDRALGFPSYSRCMNYCGNQWSVTLLGDTIWGCIDSVHHATKRYYTERNPNRLNPSRCRWFYSEYTVGRGEVGRIGWRFRQSGDMEPDTLWWPKTVKDSIWYCEKANAVAEDDVQWIDSFPYVLKKGQAYVLPTGTLDTADNDSRKKKR